MSEPTKYDIAEHRRRLKEWAYTLAEHKIFCYEYFGGRADTVIEYSEKLKEDTELGSIQMLDICMQIEAEFPNRIEEIYDRAQLHPNGMLIGLSQYIRHIRNNG